MRQRSGEAADSTRAAGGCGRRAQCRGAGRDMGGATVAALAAAHRQVLERGIGLHPRQPGAPSSRHHHPAGHLSHHPQPRPAALGPQAQCRRHGSGRPDQPSTHLPCGPRHRLPAAPAPAVPGQGDLRPGPAPSDTSSTKALSAAAPSPPPSWASTSRTSTSASAEPAGGAGTGTDRHTLGGRQAVSPGCPALSASAYAASPTA